MLSAIRNYFTVMCDNAPWAARDELPNDGFVTGKIKGVGRFFMNKYYYCSSTIKSKSTNYIIRRWVIKFLAEQYILASSLFAAALICFIVWILISKPEKKVYILKQWHNVLKFLLHGFIVKNTIYILAAVILALKYKQRLFDHQLYAWNANYWSIVLLIEALFYSLVAYSVLTVQKALDNHVKFKPQKIHCLSVLPLIIALILIKISAIYPINSNLAKILIMCCMFHNPLVTLKGLSKVVNFTDYIKFESLLYQQDIEGMEINEFILV